jgi:hypothetical protein
LRRGFEVDEEFRKLFVTFVIQIVDGNVSFVTTCAEHLGTVPIHPEKKP